MIQKIDHVGIAVDDIEVALQMYAGPFGLKLEHIEEVASQGIRSFHLPVGESRLELLVPLNPEDAASPIAKFLAKNGPGIHHIAFAVDDVDAARAALVAHGLQPIGEPSMGADGKRIQFFHPKSTGGALIEVCGKG
jgi:methylmalonyl-CoA/ethylmalonyl-CoA epimerase